MWYFALYCAPYAFKCNESIVTHLVPIMKYGSESCIILGCNTYKPIFNVFCEYSDNKKGIIETMMRGFDKNTSQEKKRIKFDNDGLFSFVQIRSNDFTSIVHNIEMRYLDVNGSNKNINDINNLSLVPLKNIVDYSYSSDKYIGTHDIYRKKILVSREYMNQYRWLQAALVGGIIVLD